MLKDILPDFQEFLTSRGFADEKHAPFYARWVSNFIAFSNEDKNAAKLDTDPASPPLSGKSDSAPVINAMSKAIRVKHYSYKTERTYINWAKNFYEYTAGIKKKDIAKSGLSSEDVRDYLSYLAIKKKVSSSSQNQAFNALLFLFRDVLMIGLDDISNAPQSPLDKLYASADKQ